MVLKEQKYRGWTVLIHSTNVVLFDGTYFSVPF